MKKTIACALWLFVSAVFYAAPENPSWLRYPAISPDGKTIVFTYKGDLYRVPSRRRNGHAAHDAHGARFHAGMEP